jgi:electron transport complex protein RnfB
VARCLIHECTNRQRATPASLPQAVNVTRIDIHPATRSAAQPPTLADQIEDLLPQTQCTKCGYPACRPYAEAIASGSASHNQCPPGGIEGVARLAAMLGKPVIPLNPDNGVERPRPLAVIDENLCIGCTLCLQACPVDAIVGAAKQMHTIIPALCTGCDLCVPPCPVDCIAMIPVTGNTTGWHAWTQDEANAARVRHDRRAARLERERDAAEARSAALKAAKVAEAPLAANPEPESLATDDAAAKKRAIIQAAMERAARKKADLAKLGAGPRNTDAVTPEVQAQIDAAEARRRRLGLTAESAPSPDPASTPRPATPTDPDAD